MNSKQKGALALLPPKKARAYTIPELNRGYWLLGTDQVLVYLQFTLT
ncbi:MAG: hypothetical protein ABI760_01400 [Ferruginibacter sp.]